MEGVAWSEQRISTAVNLGFLDTTKENIYYVRFEFLTMVTMKNAFSGLWRRVVLVWTDVSEERIASIFGVEKSASKEPAWAGGCSLQQRFGKHVTCQRRFNRGFHGYGQATNNFHGYAPDYIRKRAEKYDSFVRQLFKAVAVEGATDL
jgi:hypothetical protein